MNNRNTNIGNFHCKKYIHRTWDGIRDFFIQYVGVLPGIRERLNLPTADIGLITESSAAYGRINDLIDETDKYLTALREYRIRLLNQKNSNVIASPSAQRLKVLIDQLGNPPGGLLWLEDKLSDLIRRNPATTPEDLTLLGIDYKPDSSLSPDKIVGKIYVQFDGGKVAVHWTLPRGYHDVRLSSKMNHGVWETLYAGSEGQFIDERPIPATAEIRAYKLEIMTGGKPIGKPIEEKVIVGQDIMVEEQKI